jgi:hypothetical protein
MIAFLLWCALGGLIAYLVGQAARLGASPQQSGCDQNCRQGRACRCAARVDGETPP